MSDNNMFQGDIDPEIAALLGTPATVKNKAPESSSPDYSKLFGEADLEDAGEMLDVDLSQETFPAILHPYEEQPHQAFNDPDYYKKSLSGEGDISQRVHGLIQKYINAKDPKDKSVYRQQLITAVWDFLLGIARKCPSKQMLEPKKFLLRFGILHPTFITPEDRALFSKITVENGLRQPIFYLDEWFKSVGTGLVKPSSTDEVRVAKSNEQLRIQQLLDKATGKRDAARNLLKAKSDERTTFESALEEKAKSLAEHAAVPGIPDIKAAYTDVQRRAFNDVQEILKTLVRCDRELDGFLRDYTQAELDVQSLEEKIGEEGAAATVDIKAVDTEFETVKQMAKLTIGRQGNHFPILTREYFRCTPNEIGTRENIIAQLAWIESIDPEALCRSYKNKLNRIVPYVILLPTYGDLGVCWEPFDRFNRATSRGRIAVPMYPKNLVVSVLSAVADLRWQVAKEKASYYWMEEGLTGNYYQWFTSKKLKGDVKEAFIQDYIIWITKESDAVQKMEKEVRGLFWRFVPFSKPVKEKLKSRSYIYQELYQRDVNRTMSDGY